MKAYQSCLFAVVSFGLTGIVTGATSEASCFVGGDVVLEWNQVAIDTIGTLPPFPSSRAMAAVELAVYEAVDSITGKYEPYLGSITARRSASPEAAAIAAAHGVLKGLFPAAAAALDPRREQSLLALADGPAKLEGIRVGEMAAAAMLAEREGDGSAPLEFFLPPDRDPGDWQPTPSCSPSGGAFANWQDVLPFGIESSSQFRAPAPFPITSRRYARDFDEVKRVGSKASTERPQDRSNVALLYAAQPPHVGWNSVARQLAGAHPDDITATARIFALLNAAIADSLIAVFESKYYYDYWRPETAIARADEDGNARTEADPSFAPFITAPCFPSYPSGHGTGAGAGSTILTDAYGDGGHDISNAVPSLPGITLHYESLSQIVRDVSDARVYGGIHFRNDQDAAEALGRQVAEYELEHLFRRVRRHHG